MIVWQDIIFAAGGLIFAIALIPQAYDVYNGKSVNTTSALLTGMVLLAFVVSYWSLGLYYAAETTLATATIWLYIAAGSWWNNVPNRV